MLSKISRELPCQLNLDKNKPKLHKISILCKKSRNLSPSIVYKIVKYLHFTTKLIMMAVIIDKFRGFQADFQEPV